MKPNTWPRHPFGLPGIQAALLSHHVLQSGTHQALSMPARNRAIARAMAVLNIELEIGPFPLEPNTRCAIGMSKADHSSPAPALLFGVGMGTIWAGKANIWLSPRPDGAFRYPS